MQNVVTTALLSGMSQHKRSKCGCGRGNRTQKKLRCPKWKTSLPFSHRRLFYVQFCVVLYPLQPHPPAPACDRSESGLEIRV